MPGKEYDRFAEWSNTRMVCQSLVMNFVFVTTRYTYCYTSSSLPEKAAKYGQVPNQTDEFTFSVTDLINLRNTSGLDDDSVTAF